MACFVFKSCCGCLELQMGSLLIGHILLVIKVLWLFFSSRSLNFYITNIFSRNFNSSDLTVALVLSVIDEVTLVLELIFIVILLIGLYKKKRGYLRAFYQPSVICFGIECIAFIAWMAYFGFQIIGIYIAVIFTANVITKLLTSYFLLVVRSYYLQTSEISDIEAFYNTRPKQSKLGIYYMA